MAAEVRIEPSWKNVLSGEFDKQYFTKLSNFVKSEYQSRTVYPKGSEIFKAFELTPFDEVKVVILGQDPYHGPGQAHGLCFSVNQGIALPPSLQNIYRELDRDLAVKRNTGNLESWARQGVLLLNSILTVRAGEAGSHRSSGWEDFTDAAIKAVGEKKENVVYMLWGAYAQKKIRFISTHENLILKSPHPSPLSAHRGFIGNGHFSKANQYLKSKGKEEIQW
jgi:uracil-DNA glycosylase